MKPTALALLAVFALAACRPEAPAGAPGEAAGNAADAAGDPPESRPPPPRPIYSNMPTPAPTPEEATRK